MLYDQRHYDTVVGTTCPHVAYRAIFASLSIAVLSACSSVPPNQVAEFTKLNRKPAGNSPANINVGDSVELFVMEDNSFNGIYKIREKGDIIVPKIGRIVIHGMTVEAAQSRIRQVLLSSQLTAATVILDRVSSSGVRNFAETPKMLVFVTGKVNKPGQHMIAVENGNPVLAYEALLIAGGTTPFADEKRSYILRRGGQGSRQKIPLDLRAIRQGNANDVPLVEGDMIFVPERRFAL